jgi:hypothetical protein
VVSKSQHPEVARTLALAAVAAFALFCAALLISTLNEPASIFGWNLGPDGRTLIYVTPGKPAANAGIRAGDRVDWRNLSVLGRANLGLVQAVSPHARLRITIYRGASARTVQLASVPWDPLVVIGQRMATAAGLILVAIGIGLVYLRPTRMTWGFVLASLAPAIPISLTFWGQSSLPKFFVTNGSLALLTGTAATGTLMFMSRFPADRARGPLAMLDRAAVPLGIAVALPALYNVLTSGLSPIPPPAWSVFTSEYLLSIAIAMLALGALLTSYALTKGSDRQRVTPVLLTFAFWVACSMATVVYNALYTSAIGTGTLFVLSAFAMLALAAAVAHGVIRHRVLDVSFVISRTLVYTVLTSIIVGAFVLVDFISSKMLEHFQITIAIEVLVALAFGTCLNRLHARIDRFVDSVLFRRRHLAEARLDRSARTLAHAETTPFIDEALTIEACDALALTSAAVFRRDGGDVYERVLARGWGDSHVQEVPTEDHLVVNLLAELQALDLSEIRWPHHDVPHGIAHPLLAIPLCVRHELLGFVLYGGHLGGEAIDPDEKRTLLRLSEAAAAAYEHVRAKALLAEADDLRNKNTLLQHEQRYLREMVDALRGVTPHSSS